MVEFASDRVLILRTIIIVNICFTIVYFITPNESPVWIYLLLLVIVNVAYASLYLKRMPKAIIINESENKLEVHSEDGTSQYHLDNLKATFVIVTKARGVRAEVFQLFLGNEKILEIDPNTNGWSKKKLKELSLYINSLDNIPYSPNS
jgi:hypothetical protein